MAGEMMHSCMPQNPPMKIKLIKGQKDSYGWEISISGESFEEILPKLNTANAMLKIEYGNKE